MSPLIINLVSALAISLVIACMVSVKSPRAKSIIVVIPIPITIALMASGGRATSLSIIGLALTNCFIWTVYYLYKKGVNILAADVFAAIMYVGIGYVITQTTHVAFEVVATIYLFMWLLLMVELKSKKYSNHDQPAGNTPLVYRSTIIFLIAYSLLSMKQYLAAFVVTFPYNTIFSVYENRRNLFVQAALFSRNSLALWAYFIANYYLTSSGAQWYAYVASWTAFGIFIFVLNKKLPLSIN